MNKNQRRIRDLHESNVTSFEVPRRDYDKGCSNGRPGGQAFVAREIPFGHQKRKSTKPKVAHKRR